ncbi:hypothetical protein E3P86_03531 [Wallemia ichthyophaga]|uniref:GDP/GTP exchange factor Sec2 N-terminal domain-containing protein n=1 Tax=Wallemia ichthyophaga TaxID=245174 RepID=A0A4T0IKC9_WALIC|nr:hypothetical protein E3P86_03531 [Wallemia ichthyophaga]
METSSSIPSLIDNGPDYADDNEDYDDNEDHGDHLGEDSEVAHDSEAIQGSPAANDIHVIPSPDDIPAAQPHSSRSTSLLNQDIDKTAARAASNPHALVIAFLRAQIDELTSQLNSLNAKLVHTFDKSDNLQQELDEARTLHHHHQLRITALEKETAAVKTSLDNGTLVERENVMHELTHMVDSIVTETQKATLARQDKAAIEQDLDDLSANLFAEANRMVGVERLLKAQEADRRRVAEERLVEAEEAVRVTQRQMSEWVERGESSNGALQPPAASDSNLKPTLTPVPTLTHTHIPYLEFISYLHTLASAASVRQRASESQTPSQLLPLDLSHAFLRRLLEEDVEPTLRLDLSRAFGLLTRGKVLTAVTEGTLELEPARGAEFAPGTECALSGRVLIPVRDGEGGHKGSASQSSFFSWSGSGRGSSRPASTGAGGNADAGTGESAIHVFRLSASPTATRYPVDAGWAVPRLRAACELWRYVRALQASVVTMQPPFCPPAGCQTREAFDASIGRMGLKSGRKGGDGLSGDTNPSPTIPPPATGRSFWGAFQYARSTPSVSAPPSASPSPLHADKTELPDETKKGVRETQDIAGRVDDHIDEGSRSDHTHTQQDDTHHPHLVLSNPQQPPPKPKRGRRSRGRKGTVTGAPPSIPSQRDKEDEEGSENKNQENIARQNSDDKSDKNVDSNTTLTQNTLDLQLSDTAEKEIETETETWEMARWRQIVELKQNMFWARVNGDPNTSM